MPRTKRKIGLGFAGLTQSCGAVHDEITLAVVGLSAVALAKADDPGHSPSEITSPSRKARPSNPPKFARKSVERLPRTIGTSTPPETASQARQPIRGGRNFSSSSACERATCPAGNDRDPI